MASFKCAHNIDKRTTKVVGKLPTPKIDFSAIRHRRLLVLDMDHTLLDVTSPLFDVDKPETFLRPGVKRFLTHVAKSFDIAFWSLSRQEAVNAKMQLLRIDKLGIRPVFAIGRQYSVRMKFESRATKQQHTYLAKPLEFVSERLPYDQEDILHIDDNGLCTLLSGNNVVLVRPWFHSHATLTGVHYGHGCSIGDSDSDLQYLAGYLDSMGVDESLIRDHKEWMAKCPVKSVVRLMYMKRPKPVERRVRVEVPSPCG